MDNVAKHSWVIRALSKLIGKFSVESTANTLGIGGDSSSGVNVTPENSLSSTAVLSAVRGMSETIAMMPLHLMQQDGNRKIKASDHPVYKLLLRNANPEQTAMEMREQTQASAMIRGNGYAEIQFNKYGNPVALWPLPSRFVTLERKPDGQLIYWVEVNGVMNALLPYQVLHIKGFTAHGLMGAGLIDLCRNAVGLAKAYEEYGATYFKNGAAPLGYLQHPGKVGDVKRLKETWDSAHAGLSNAHRTAVLEEGMTYNKMGLSPEESQLIEGRTFQISEIARILNMPLHRMYELSRAHFNNIVELGIEYVVYSLQPWGVRWEQRIAKQLLNPTEQDSYYAKHSFESLLRGDPKTRAEFYRVMLSLGILTINEVRDIEDWNPIGDEGDLNLVPLNMAPATSYLNWTPNQGSSAPSTGILSEVKADPAVIEGIINRMQLVGSNGHAK